MFARNKYNARVQGCLGPGRGRQTEGAAVGGVQCLCFDSEVGFDTSMLFPTNHALSKSKTEKDYQPQAQRSSFGFLLRNRLLRCLGSLGF